MSILIDNSSSDVKHVLRDAEALAARTFPAREPGTRRVDRIHFHPFGPACKPPEIPPGPVTRGNGSSRPTALGKRRSPFAGQPSAGRVSPTAPQWFVVKNGP